MNFDTSFFDLSYGNTLSEFEKLLNTDNDKFSLIFDLCDNHLRNAITHSEIWNDTEKNIVNYKDKKKYFSISSDIFFTRATIISYLPLFFLTAVSTLDVLQHGTEEDIQGLPPHLVKLYKDDKPIIKPSSGDD
jgi:hypothetical protein